MEIKATDTTSRQLPTWRAMHADTARWAEDVQLKFFREAPAWRKLEMANELTKGMLSLAESGLRSRHPQAPADEVRRRLADLLLGSELAFKVYGPLIDSRGKRAERDNT